MSRAERPRLVIAAVHSSSGKTTITGGIIAALTAAGLRVHPYKVGPDYIDPGYLGLAAGSRADNLDTWLTDEAVMKRIFVSASKDADISVIEGVMGLYDGGQNGISSTAQIARVLNAPVLLVIDVRSMGESAAAVAKGFRDYDRSVDIRGVIINRYGSDSHKNMVCEAIERIGIPVLGAVPRNKEAEVRERHLGLLPVEENNSREHNEKIRMMIEPAVNLEAIIKIARSAPALEEGSIISQQSDKKVKIAVARDEAFSFYYPESIAAVEAAGAEMIYFSPLHDESIPECHGLIFGGGFPEVFAAQLAANLSMKGSISRAAKRGMPVYAECGGFMYLTNEIIDFDGRLHKMTGLIPMSCKMNDSMRTVGYVTAEALDDNIIAVKGEKLRGHEFHFSTAEPEGPIQYAFEFTKNRTQEKYTAGFASDNILGSYLHLHFAGFPKAAERLVDRCLKYKNRL
ncbi:MAG: cobyrinate a,c-diamide synthase [Synergistaceae bacterium]|nr:cobyrinate a,c-diamide synthase [Synergistaceae bacterium]